jgi:hypothetical protein
MRGENLFTWDKFNDNEAIRSQAVQAAKEGGANSGFEMPDTDFFKQPELANQFPDMKDDIDLIISTESYIHRLVDFDNRMKKAKGMSRGMAHELLELIPSLESHVKPNGFTEDVSGVGYQPSLESISAQMWVVIAAAAAFLVAIIYKFTSWLFGNGGGSSSSGGGSLDKAEEGVKQSEKKVEQQEKVLDKTVRTVQAARGKDLEIKMPAAISHEQVRASNMPESLKEQIIKEIPDLLDSTKIDPVPSKPHFLKINLTQALSGYEGGQQVLDYMKKPSRYARVVFATQRGDAMSLITDSFNGFNAHSKVMLGELEALKEAFEFGKEASSAFSESSHSSQMAASMKEQAGLGSLYNLVGDKAGTFKVGSHSFQSTAEWAQKLKDAIHEEGTQTPNFNDLEELLSGYQIGVRRLKEVDWRGMIAFIEVLKRSQPILGQLEQKAKELQKKEKGTPGISNQMSDYERASSIANRTAAKEIVSLQRMMAEDYAGLMRVYAEISRVYTEVTKNAAEVVNTLRKNAAGIVALYNKVGEMVPPSLEELADDLSELSTQARESTVNQHMLPFVSVSHLKVSFGGSDDDDNEDRPSISMSSEEAANALKIVTGQKPNE